MPPTGSFTPADFDVLRRLVIDRWTDGVDRDWTARAGSLEWSCLSTADHLVDCVFSYALFLGSAKLDGYPNFDGLHGAPGATATDLIDGLRAVTSMLWALTVSFPADSRAVIRRRPTVETGGLADFAARGALELVLHGHDVCEGLDLSLDPPRDVIGRLLTATQGWPGTSTVASTDDVWSDLVVRSGRPHPRPPAGEY